MNKLIEKLYDLSNDVVVLTGAGGKLGSFYAKEILESGAKIALLDSNDELLNKLTKSIDIKYKDKFIPINCDISEKNSVEEAFKLIDQKLGLSSILINNAAAHQTTFVGGNLIEFEEFPIEVWKENLEVNLTGAFLCSQFAGKRMLENNKGAILNIGSTYGVVACDQRIYGDSGLNSHSAYAATKGGIVNFTRYLASYWQGKNIRVNCLSPGGVFNNQSDEFFNNYINKTMIKRMAKPEDLTAAVLYLITDASDWVTGTNMIVDGGFTAW